MYVLLLCKVIFLMRVAQNLKLSLSDSKFAALHFFAKLLVWINIAVAVRNRKLVLSYRLPNLPQKV